jgi:hypothetical protein
MTSSATAARMPPPAVLEFAEHQQDLMPHAFNNQAIEYGKIPSFKPKQNAFNHSKKDIPLSAASACKAKSRAVRDIVVAVKNAGSLHHQVVALNGAMMHPKMRCVGKSIGFAADAGIALFHQEQQKRMIALARTTTTEKGRPTDDKRLFAQSLILAPASSPNSKPIGNRKRAKVLGLPYSTTHRLFKNAKVVGSQLKNIEEGLSWSTVGRKKSRSNVTEEMRAKLHAWVLNHPHVVDSPIARDTLLIKDPETGKKVRTGKVLLEVSVRELHNDLLDLPANGGLDCAKNAEGKVLISDTALRYLLPPKPQTDVRLRSLFMLSEPPFYAHRVPVLG